MSTAVLQPPVALPSPQVCKINNTYSILSITADDCLLIDLLWYDVHFQATKRPAPAKTVESTVVGDSPKRKVAKPMELTTTTASAKVSAPLPATQHQPASPSAPKASCNVGPLMSSLGFKGSVSLVFDSNGMISH